MKHFWLYSYVNESPFPPFLISQIQHQNPTPQPPQQHVVVSITIKQSSLINPVPYRIYFNCLSYFSNSFCYENCPKLFRNVKFPFTTGPSTSPWSHTRTGHDGEYRIYIPVNCHTPLLHLYYESSYTPTAPPFIPTQPHSIV